MSTAKVPNSAQAPATTPKNRRSGPTALAGSATSPAACTEVSRLASRNRASDSRVLSAM